MLHLEMAPKDSLQEWVNVFNTQIYPIFYVATDAAIRDEVVHMLSFGELDPDCVYLFIKDAEQQIIGTIYYKTKRSIHAYINWFYIIPSYQNNWYGTEAFQLLITRLWDEQYEHVYLETRLEYTRATAFYEKLGLEKISSTEELQKHYLGKLYNYLLPHTLFYYKHIF